MGHDKVRSEGRVRYVEPNDFLEESLYGNNGSFNTTHPYEDYSMHVDLIVKVPDRHGKAENNDGTIIELGTFNAEKISFFNGTGGYLTNIPSGITYRDIMNGNIDGTNESLGITNIHIAYNSYFYPEVTIQFSDVRGSALMGSHEENYRMEEINNARNERIYTKKVKSFFTSLFSFPYPEFTLSVKGFYGRKVNYSLLVTDFRSSFNNDTGNFDCTVKFVGKMYGMYTDIPMSYLLIAPYCKYGSINNKTVWQDLNLTFDDGTKLPTFIELSKKLLNGIVNLKKNISKNLTDEFSKITHKIQLLQDINNSLLDFKNEIGGNHNKNVIIVDNIFLFDYDENNECDYLYPNNKPTETNRVEDCVKKINELINRYEIEVDSNGIPFFKLLDGKTELNASSKIGNNKDSVITVKFENNQLKIENDVNLSDSIKRYLTHKLRNEVNERKFFFISCKEMTDTLQSYRNNAMKIQENLSEQAKKETNELIENILDFKPTIKNVFKILMGHLQAFTKIYSLFISNVSGEKIRTIEDLGFSRDNVTDLPDNNSMSNKMTVPPFPGFRNPSDNTFCYPDETITKKTMEETILIDSLLDSVFTYISDLDNLNKLKDEVKSEDIEFIPTCLSDLILRDNPYEYVFDNNNSDIYIDWILTFFGIRCIIKNLLEKGESANMSPETFGKLEAYNFWRKNQDLSRDAIKKLEASECNGINFINFLLNNDFNKYKINNKLCYETNTIKNLLISANKGLTIPSNGSENRYNFPCLIGREHSGISQFYEDSLDDKNRYSFKNLTFVPYISSGFIESDALNKWNEQLLKFDLSGYCTDEIKKNIIGQHIEITEDMFTTNTIYKKISSKIIYRTKTNKIFSDDYTSKNYYDDGRMELKEAYNKKFQDIKLSSISSEIGNIPMFFGVNTSENFLISLPHNWKRLESLMKDGQRTISIPYSTRLTIGMVIKWINEHNDIKNYTEFFDKFDFTNIIQLIKVISMLTRDINGDICTDIIDKLEQKNNLAQIEEKNDLINKIFENRHFFKVDCLNLSDEYNEWSRNVKSGGYQYFVNYYSLHDISKDNRDDNLEYIENWDNLGNDIYSRLKEYVKMNVKDDNVNKEKLNNHFQPVINVKNSSTPFSDRYSNIDIVDGKYIYLVFNENFIAYKSLSEFFSRTSKLVLPYQIKQNKEHISYGREEYTEYSRNRYIERSELESCFNAFKNKLIELYGEEKDPKKNSDYKPLTKHGVTIESKLSMYQTLKNLYDKHLNSLNKNYDIFDIEKENSEFKRFHFIDTFYNDLSDTLYFNLDILYELIDVIQNEHGTFNSDGSMNSEMSLYSFMSLICERHNMLLLAVPVFNWYENECVDGLKDMFTPKPYKDSISEAGLEGPSYICFYPHQSSQHLDIPDSQYKNDGFDLVDLNDTGNFNGATHISDLDTINDENIVIPAFGVEYGSQKQSIFKNIRINMDNPQTTEIAVANQFDLARQKNSKGARSLGFEGQELFKIYSNYSFTCQVDMMGCAQIQPLMYFQLNNIPMFRGAYQIIQVEHDIVPGNMITTFKGVRINKTKIPMMSSGLNVIKLEEILTEAMEENEKPIYKPMNIPNTKDISDVDLTNIDNLVSSKELKSKFGDIVKFLNVDINQEEAFNELNYELRKLIYSILNDIETLNKKSDERGYKIGMYITSTVRSSGSTKSDHYVGVNGNPSEKRKKLKSYNANGEEKELTKLGCAIDIQGTRDGVIDKGEASVIIYSLIANKYPEYCRQLIWEQKGYNSNNIQVIHIASYGKENNDKNEIYHGSYPSGKRSDSKNLPSEFINIVKQMVDSKIAENVDMVNFSKLPTSLELENMYLKSTGLLT